MNSGTPLCSWNTATIIRARSDARCRTVPVRALVPANLSILLSRRENLPSTHPPRLMDNATKAINIRHFCDESHLPLRLPTSGFWAVSVKGQWTKGHPVWAEGGYLREVLHNKPSPVFYAIYPGPPMQVLQILYLVTTIVTNDFEHAFFHGCAHHDLVGLFE